MKCSWSMATRVVQSRVNGNLRRRSYILVLSPDERHFSRQVFTESRCGAKQFKISWADQRESRMPESKVGSTCWVGSRCFSFRRPLNQTSAERSWAPDRMRQVKRPRSRRTGVYLKAGTLSTNSVKPTQPARHRSTEKQQGPTREPEGSNLKIGRTVANFRLSSTEVSPC